LILVIDNFDSFTYNLVDYLNQLDLEVAVVRNNESLKNILHSKFDGILLSPGPGVPKNAGNLLCIIEYYYRKLPILGICLGHQAIGEFFGSKIVKAQKPMHGKISKIYHTNDPLFKNIPTELNVVRYHSLVCNNLPVDLEMLARTHDGEIMALKHRILPIYGLQFHPEAVLTQYGLEILRNWKNINSL